MLSHPLGCYGSIKKGICNDCHEDQAASYAKDGTTCLACHMARAAKSAIRTGKYSGDVRSHIFRINTDPRANMFATTTVKGFLTLDFACLGCHQGRDRKWAAANAGAIH